MKSILYQRKSLGFARCQSIPTMQYQLHSSGKSSPNFEHIPSRSPPKNLCNTQKAHACPTNSHKYTKHIYNQ